MTGIYNQVYGKSHALIIGINDYINAPDLGYAVSDAEAVKSTLSDKFDFPPEETTCLTNSEATREGILKAYMSLCDTTAEDDRVFFFFAGHGHTRSGKRKETGFLVPSDGNPSDLSSLIPWDELTRSSDLIPAKHILFVIDACYGGVALTRSMRGSYRFLKDMLSRCSRQVLTAGKADEVVADSGGPRPNHSIFTGHFLDALDGAAKTDDGVITANRVMAYVYDKVASDHFSNQTPHHGVLEGDGDFIFEYPESQLSPDAEKNDDDILVSVPLSSEARISGQDNYSEDLLKEYLCDRKFRIKLLDLIDREIELSLNRIDELNYPSNTSDVTDEDFAERVTGYEMAIEPLSRIMIILSYWAEEDHDRLIERIIQRIGEREFEKSGKTIWVNLNYYPLTRLAYLSGIAAIAAGNYRLLGLMFSTTIHGANQRNESESLVSLLTEASSQLERCKGFKLLPDHEKFYVAQSEYMFTSLQPILDDCLRLGRGYEDIFDRFEIFKALVYADARIKSGNSFWGSPGRYAWKARSRTQRENPLTAISEECVSAGESWPPINSGLFESVEHFSDLKTRCDELISEFRWY